MSTRSPSAASSQPPRRCHRPADRLPARCGMLFATLRRGWPCATAPGRLPGLSLGLLLILLPGLGACSRSESEWLADTRADDPFVRTLAVVALTGSDWEDPTAVVDHLIQALSDADREVATRAGQTLLDHAGSVYPILLQQVGRPDARIREHLLVLTSRLGEDALHSLEAALAEPQPSAGPFLVELLKQAGPDAREALLAATRHPDERIRRAALGTLAVDAERSDAGSLRLLEAVDDPSPGIRALALDVVVRTACRRLEDRDPSTRRAAAARLDSLGPVAVRELGRLMLDGKEALRRPARAWLATRDPSEVTAFLAGQYGGDPLGGARAIVSICEHIELFGPPAIPALRRELTIDDPARRVAAAAGLGGLGSSADSALPDLLALLDDPDENVRLTAALAVMLVGVTEEPVLDELVARARRIGAPPDGKGDERLARALGTAAVGGVLRRSMEPTTPEERAAALDVAVDRLEAWGPTGRDWVAEVSEHALTDALRLRASEALERLDGPPDR